MPDKPTPQPKPTNSQAAQPVESPLDVAQQPPKSIRSNLMSGQVESAPIISEAAFAQPGNQAGPQKPAAADAKPVKPAHLKGRHSKLFGLLSVMGLLLLASVALFFTYRSYQASYQKVQKSRVSNSIAPTNVDLGGLAPTSTTLQGVGLLQVNGDANITNNVTANSFSGGGADLSNLNATNITSGTLNDARLSPNVALLDANQAFTGSNSFGGSTNFTGSSNFTGAVVLPGTLTINSLTYNMPGSQAAGSLSNDGSGNLTWQPSGSCPTCVNTGGNSYGAAMSVGTNDNFDLTFRTNGITRLTFDTAGNATFAGTIVGNGSGITNLNGSNVSSGTVADARLSSNVAFLNAANVFATTNTFSAGIVTNSITPTGSLTIGSAAQAFVLRGTSSSTITATSGAFTTTLGFDAPTANRNISIPNESGTICTTGSVCTGYAPASGASSYLNLQATTPGTAQTGNANITGTLVAGFLSGSGASITSLNATNIANGTLSDARLSSNVTVQGNTFNAANKLVQLDGAGFLPALNGSLLTDLNGSNITTGTVADARLSSNVALLNTNQTFTGDNTFTGNLTLPGSITINSNLYNFPATSAAGSLVNDGIGNLTWATNSACPTCITDGGNSFGAAMSVGTNDPYDLTLRTNGVTRLTFNTTGDATFAGAIYGDGTQLTGVAKLALNNQTFTGNSQVFQNNSNSTSAFSVKNAGAVDILSVDSTNSIVNISNLSAGTVETNTITPTSALTIGATGQSFTLQGDISSTITATGASGVTTISFANPIANVNYQLPSVSAGTYDICTSAGNCAGVSGSVGTPGGTANKLAKFSSTYNIVDSIISDNGSLATIGGSLEVDGSLKVMSSSPSYLNFNSSQVQIYNGTTTTNYNFLASGNTTYDICTSSGNCLGGGGGGANVSLSNLSSVAINTSLLPGASTAIDLGSNTLPLRDLYIYGTSATPASQNFKLTGAATAQRTITFPDENGTVCTTGSICSGYGNNTLSNLGTVALNSVLQPASAGSLSLGVSTLPFSDLYLSGSSATPATNRFQITGTSTGGLRVITMPDATGTICLENSASCGFAASSGGSNYIQNQTAVTQTAGFKINGTGTVGTLNATSAIQLGGASINTGGTLSNVAYLDQANTFTAAGTALTVNNNATISGTLTSGLINGQTISSSANFTGTATVAGSSLTLGTASVTNGSVVFKNATNSLGLTLSAPNTTQARAIYFPDEDGTICTSASSSTSICTNFAPATGSTVYANTNLSNLVTTAINSDLNFASASGKSITGPGSPGLSVTNASGDLTLSTTTSGTLAISSAGAVNISGQASSSWSIGATSDLSIVSKNLNLNSGGALTVGSTGSSSGTLVLKNSAAASGSITLGTNNTGASSFAITFPNQSGTVCTSTDLGGSVCSGYAPSTGGSYAKQDLSNLASVAINTSLLPGANNSIDAGSSGLAFRTAYAATSVLTPALDVISAGTLAIGNTTATGINIGNSTNAAAITVGDGANTSTLKFGAGAGAKAVTIGSTNTTSITTINSGSSGRIDIAAGPSGGSFGSINIGSYNGALADGVTVNVGNTGTTSGTNIYGGTSGINLYTATNGTITFATDNQNRFTISATASTLTGNGATTLTSSGGTMSISSGGGSAITVDSAGAGTVNFSNGTTAKTINLGTGATGIKTINIGGTAANVISIGNTQTAGSIAMGAAMTTGTITIGGTGAQTGTIGIGTGTGTQTLSFGTGAGAKTVNVGSTNTTSGTVIASGSGNINFRNGSATNLLVMDSSGNLTFDSSVAPTISIASRAANPGRALTMYGGDCSVSACVAGALNLNGGTATGGGTSVGGAVNIASGNGLSSGAVTISTASSGASGAINITPGGGLYAGASGGNVVIAAGAGNTTGNGGSISLTSGASASGTPGSISITSAGSLTLSRTDTFATSVGFSGTPTGIVTYNFDRAATAGTYTVCTTSNNCLASGGGADQALSNLASVAINTSLLPGANNSIDAGSSGLAFRTAYAATSVLTPAVDTIAAGTLSLGTGTATGLTLGKASYTVSVPGGLTTNGSAIATAGGGLSTSNGSLTLGSGNITTTGTYNSNTFTGSALTFAGAASVASGGTNTDLSLDGNGSGAVNIGGGGTSTGDINFGGGSTSTGCTVTNSNGNFACSGTGTFNGVSTGNVFVNGGNSFGATAYLGTTDANNLVFRTGLGTNAAQTRFTIGSGSATLTGTGATTINTTNTMTVGSSASSTNITAGTTVALNPAASGILNLGINMTTGSINMGTAMTTGQITIGTTSSTGAISVTTGGALTLTGYGGATLANGLYESIAANGGKITSVFNDLVSGNGISFQSYLSGEIAGINLSGFNSTYNVTAPGLDYSGALTIGGTSASSISLGAAVTTGAITIGGTAQTGTIDIGTGTGAQSINLGTGGTGAKTVVLGSTASTSTTTINAGTNGIVLAGKISGNATFLNDAAHTISIAQSTVANAAGSALSIVAGQSINVTSGSSGAGGALNLTGGANNTGGYNGSAGGAVNIAGGLSAASAIPSVGGIGGAVNITGGTGSAATGFAANVNGGIGGALVLTGGSGGAGTGTGIGGKGGDVTISSGGSTTGAAAGDLILQSGGGLGSSGAVTLKSLNTAGSSGSVTISTGTSAFTSGDINLTTQAGSSAANTGRVIITSPTDNASGALSLTAASTTTGTAMAISANALTSGKGLDISSTATGLTGNMLSVTSAGTVSAGTTIGTSGLVAFNFTGTHTGYGFQVRSNTLTGTAMRIAVNSLTTGIGLDISSTTTLTTGNLLKVANTSAGAYGTTAGTSGAILFDLNGLHTGYGFQLRDSTATGTAMRINVNALTSGVGLDINSSSTLSTGKLLSVTSTSTGLTTAGTNTGTLLDLQASGASTAFTGSLASIAFAGNNAGNTGALLNIASTGASSIVQSILVTNNSIGAPANGLVRFNFTGNHSGAGVKITDSSSSSGYGLESVMSGTSGFAVVARASGTGGEAGYFESTSATRTAYVARFLGLGSDAETLIIQDSTAYCTGNPGATMVFSCSSDQSLKDNIANSSSILDGLTGLQIRAFDWKSDGTHEDYGVVAQEVENTPLSWLVKTNSTTGLKSVTTPSAYMIIKGLQELSTKIDDLQSGLSTSVLQSIASANAITINGTLTINGVTIFNGNTKFNGDITVNQDGAGEATIPAGDSSIDVTFSKELASIPMVTASPQDFIDGQYKITNVTKNGFTIRTSTNQTSDVKFSWTSVQK